MRWCQPPEKTHTVKWKARLLQLLESKVFHLGAYTGKKLQRHEQATNRASLDVVVNQEVKNKPRGLLPARVNVLGEILLDHIIGLSKSIGAYTSKGGL